MSELQTNAPVEATSTPPAVSEGGEVKRAQAEQVLKEILRLMELSSKLELKDAEGGGISVAMHFEAEVPGVQAGKKSHFVDALQFLVNKIVNRPNTERRWVSLGVGGHPPPRPPPGQKQEAAPSPSGPRASAPRASSPRPSAPGAAPAQAPRNPRPGPSAPRPGNPRQNAAGTPPAARAPAPAPRPAVDEERTLEVTPDPELTKAIQSLAEKSARLGRFYAIAPAKPEDRARMLKAASGTPGMSLKLEGEGRNRRLVFVPDKPAPMPKSRGLPDDDDEDFDG